MNAAERELLAQAVEARFRGNDDSYDCGIDSAAEVIREWPLDLGPYVQDGAWTLADVRELVKGPAR